MHLIGQIHYVLCLMPIGKRNPFVTALHILVIGIVSVLDAKAFDHFVTTVLDLVSVSYPSNVLFMFSIVQTKFQMTSFTYISDT